MNDCSGPEIAGYRRIEVNNMQTGLRGPPAGLPSSGGTRRSPSAKIVRRSRIDIRPPRPWPMVKWCLDYGRKGIRRV